MTTQQPRHLSAVPDHLVTAPWEIPVPLGGTPAAPPAFPLHVLPVWARAMVDGVATSTQTCTSMSAAVLLSVLSTCAGGRIEVEAKAGWREPINAYLACIAEPGERKTPVHTMFVRALYAAQKLLAELAQPLIDEQAALKDIATRTAEHARATAAKAESGRRDELTAEAVAAVMACEAITVPSMPRLVCDDATPEALIGLMAANGGRMAIISDEGGIFDTLAGRYSGTPNLDPYLKGYSGRPMSSDRQTRMGDTVDSPALTVGVMAQPTVLRKFGANAELFGRGLPARFWFILPRSYAGWRDEEAAVPVPAHVLADYDAIITTLAVTLAGWTEAAVVTLTPEAAQLRAKAAGEIEVQLRPGGALHDMREWANKLGGTMLRVAGLLHVAHHPADAWQHPIDAQRMADAITVTGFLIAHYKAALTTVNGDPATETARHILGVLVAKDMRVFSRRSLHRRAQRQLPRVEQVRAVLETLTAHGWIRPAAPGEYELHPHAAEYVNANPAQELP